jgi:hypothetical protein
MPPGTPLWIIAPILIGSIVFVSIACEIYFCIRHHVKRGRDENNATATTRSSYPTVPDADMLYEDVNTPHANTPLRLHTPTQLVGQSTQYIGEPSLILDPVELDAEESLGRSAAMESESIELQVVEARVRSPTIPESIELPAGSEPPFWPTEPLTPSVELKG